MENAKKIISIVFYGMLLVCACRQPYKQAVMVLEDKKNLDSTNKVSDSWGSLFTDSVNNILFRYMFDNQTSMQNGAYVKDNHIYFKTVLDSEGREKNISDMVDKATFTSLANHKNNNLTIDKVDGRGTGLSDCYFVDKNYIYIFNNGKTKNNAIFFVAGKADNYMELGGDYIRINNKIYWGGNEVQDVDVQHFRTIHVIVPNQERDRIIGNDSKHLYDGDYIMDFPRFMRYSFYRKALQDSLIKTYFPEIYYKWKMQRK